MSDDWKLIQFYTRDTQGITEVVAAKAIDKTPTLVRWTKNYDRRKKAAWLVYAVSEEIDGVEHIEEYDEDFPAEPPAELLKEIEGRHVNSHAALLAACKAAERWLTSHGYDATKITVEGQLLAGLRAAIATVEAKEVAE